jgi:hypothetical protein
MNIISCLFIHIKVCFGSMGPTQTIETTQQIGATYFHPFHPEYKFHPEISGETIQPFRMPFEQSKKRGRDTFRKSGGYI